MDHNRKCKSCDVKTTITEEELLDLIDDLRKRGVDIASYDVYQRRLEKCYKCPHLDLTGTCQLCGCFVKIRAYDKNKDCPDYCESRWQDI